MVAGIRADVPALIPYVLLINLYTIKSREYAPYILIFVSSPVAGDTNCEEDSSSSHVQSRHELPNGGAAPAAPENTSCHHLAYRDNGTAGSQLEHQKSVRAEQFYDHAFFSTMLLYHGS